MDTRYNNPPQAPEMPKQERQIVFIADQYPLYETGGPFQNEARHKNLCLLKQIDALQELIAGPERAQQKQIDQILEQIIQLFKDYLQFCRERAITGTFNKYLILGWLAHEPRKNWESYIMESLSTSPRYGFRDKSQLLKNNNKSGRKTIAGTNVRI